MSETEAEQTIKDFTKSDLEKFRSWFNDFDSAQWDMEIENDIKSGRLRTVADKAISDFQSGNADKL